MVSDMEYKELIKANSEIKTVDIKGKEYATVVERLKSFRRVYPMGFVRTELISDEDGKAVIKAEVGCGDVVFGTGHAYEVKGSSFINKTSYIENCETSAVGRALKSHSSPDSSPKGPSLHCCGSQGRSK